MFERTALPEGPRVISARLPGSRSVSIAAYVLAGSRLESRRRGRRGPLHGTHHVQGHGRVPDDPGASARRSRASAARSTRPPTASRPCTGSASRGARPTRAMDVLGELIVRPSLDDAEIDSERSVIVEEIRSYQDDPSEFAQTLFQTGAVRRRPARARDLRRRSRHPGVVCGRHPGVLGGRCTGRPTRSSPSPATSSTRRPWSSPRRRSGPATASCPGSNRRPPCPPASGSDSASATRRRPSWSSACPASSAITRTRGRCPSSTPSSATG